MKFETKVNLIAAAGALLLTAFATYAPVLLIAFFASN